MPFIYIYIYIYIYIRYNNSLDKCTSHVLVNETQVNTESINDGDMSFQFITITFSIYLILFPTCNLMLKVLQPTPVSLLSVLYYT